MRLAQISKQTLRALDLSRAEAREEARVGRLWATPDGRRVALASTAKEARWALETEQVELVACSALPEKVLEKLMQQAVQRRWVLEARRRKPQPGAVVLMGPLGTRLEIAPGEDGGSVEEAVAQVLALMPDFVRSQEGG